MIRRAEYDQYGRRTRLMDLSVWIAGARRVYASSAAKREAQA